MNDTEKLLSKNAHPWGGWVCIKTIPKVEETKKESTFAGMNPMMAMMGFVHMSPEISKAIVIEIGEFESDTQFREGDIIYHPKDRGIEIGDYSYILINSVIAWDKAD